ncbi:MAG: chemotaxis protein CheD [Lentimicrobium sp.]|jgi:chemotaxis protein CheD|nr:chemotaxis protein CheD [Lentimicrobium sp.]
MDKKPVKVVQYVNTGEVSSGGIETILNSGAIGSCVVITAFDSKKKMGAMAHIMLPGRASSKNQVNATRYAANALEELLRQMKNRDVNTEDLEICLVGGANVLKRENDIIGEDNLNSIKKWLTEEQFKIKAESIGGFERRTVIFDVEMGSNFLTVGDSKQETLWQTASK